MNKHPDIIGPPNEEWMMLTDDGPEYFSTEEEASDAAALAIEDYVSESEYDLARQVIVAHVTKYTILNINIPYYENEEAYEEDYDEDEFHANMQEKKLKYELIAVFPDEVDDQVTIH